MYYQQYTDVIPKKNPTCIDPLSADPKEWWNTLKKFVGELLECVWPFCGDGAYRVNRKGQWHGILFLF